MVLIFAALAAFFAAVPLFAPGSLGMPATSPLDVALAPSDRLLARRAALPAISRGASSSIRVPQKSGGGGGGGGSGPPKLPPLTPEQKTALQSKARNGAVIGGTVACAVGGVLREIPVDQVRATGGAMGQACSGAQQVKDVHKQLKTKGGKARKRSVLTREAEVRA